MLRRIASHLKPHGQAAIALLDLEEHWEAEVEEAPSPDMLEADGWVFSSHPVAVRRPRGQRVVELDRVRRSVSPSGELEESFSRVRLALVSPAALEREARRSGLSPAPRRSVPATTDHVASTVVVLSRNA
jgi:hypothetical protein